MVMNVPMQTASINRELENRGISPDTVDVKALIDPTLSLPENKTLILTQFAGTEASHVKHSKGLQDEMTAQFCDYVGEECTKGDKEACKASCNECGTHCKAPIVQAQDKKTREYVKIDTRKAEIVGRRKERYKGVPEVKRKPKVDNHRLISRKKGGNCQPKYKSLDLKRRVSQLESRIEVIEKKFGGTKGMATKKKQHCKNTKVKKHSRKPKKCACPRDSKGKFKKKHKSR